jgi:methyl-accepting chemotaxis protein
MGFISNIKIGKRLGLGFALILAMTVLIALAGVWRLNEVAASTRTMMAAPLTKERLITDWYSLNFASIRRTAAIVKSTDPALGPTSRKTAASVKKAAELLKGIEPLIAGEEEKALFAKILDQRKLYSASRDGAVKAKADGNEEEAAKLLDQAFTPAAKLYQELLQELVVMQRTSIDATAKAIDANATRSTTIITVLTAGAVLLGAILSWLLTTGITRPIRAAVDLAETVAGGDLTAASKRRHPRRNRLPAARPAPHERQPGQHRQPRCAAAPTPSPPARPKSRPATSTCRPAPNSRPARWKKPPPRWKN